MHASMHTHTLEFYDEVKLIIVVAAITLAKKPPPPRAFNFQMRVNLVTTIFMCCK